MTEFVRDGTKLMPQIAQTYGNADCPIALNVRDVSFQPYRGDRAYDVKTTEDGSAFAVRCVGYHMRVNDDGDGNAQFARLVQCQGCTLHKEAASHTEDLQILDAERYDHTLIMNLAHPWELYRGARVLPILKLNPIDRDYAIGYIQQFHSRTIDKANPKYTQALIQMTLERNARSSFTTTHDLITAADKNPLSKKGMAEIVHEMEIRVADTIKLLLSLEPDTLGNFFQNPNIKTNVDWDYFHGFLHRQFDVDKVIVFGWPPNHWLPDTEEGGSFISLMAPDIRSRMIELYKSIL